MNATVWALLIAIGTPNAVNPQPATALVQTGTFPTRDLCERAGQDAFGRGYTPKGSYVGVNVITLCVPVQY